MRIYCFGFNLIFVTVFILGEMVHMVDAHRAAAEYREASERKLDGSSLVHHVDRRAASRSARQRRLSIYNWNPGPRRGKEDAFVKQIEGKWHVITLQEASDCVDHDILTKRFHVTHHAWRLRSSVQQGHLFRD